MRPQEQQRVQQQIQEQLEGRRRAAEDRVTHALARLCALRAAARSGLVDRVALKEALAEFSAARHHAGEARAACQRLEAEERERMRVLVDPFVPSPHARFIRWLVETGRLCG